MKNTYTTILLIVLGSLIIIELILQVSFYSQHYYRSNYSKSENNLDLSFRFNDTYLIELVPNKDKLFVRSKENGGDSIFWKTNEMGFRGSSLKVEPETRVMVYGDSNIQARFSVEESTFVYKLKKYLDDATKKDIEVINAGIVGFGPDQVLLKFEDEVKVFKPDLVVMHVFAFNDLGDIIRNRLFEIDSEGTLQKTSFKQKPDELITNKVTLKFRIWESAKSIRNYIDDKLRLNPDLENSEEYKEGVINYFVSSNNNAFNLYKQGKSRGFSHFADTYDIDVATNFPSEQVEEKLFLFEEIIKKIKEIADLNGVKIMFVIQPSIIDLTSSNYYIGYEHLESRFPTYRRDLITNSIAESIKRNQIDYLDLSPIFLENNPSELFFKNGNTHWNDKGQDLAGRKTAEYILDSLNFYRLTID